MNLFTTEALHRVTLGSDFPEMHVDILDCISWKEWVRVRKESLDDAGYTEDVKFLLLTVRAWNLTEDGKDVPLNKENLDRLSSKVVGALSIEVYNHYKPEKKSLRVLPKKS